MTREEILQAFDDINFVYNDCTRYDTLKRMLEELTERKRGEWIMNEFEEPRCSVCGKYPLQWGDESPAYSPFCPFCGSYMNMRGEENA